MFPLITWFPRLVMTVDRVNITSYKAGSPNSPAHFHFSAVPNTFRDYIDSESLTGDHILQLNEISRALVRP